MSAINERNVAARGGTFLPHVELGFPGTCAGTVGAHRLCQPNSAGEIVTATIGSALCIGANADEIERVDGDLINVAYGLGVVMADAPLIPGRPCKVGYDSRAIGFVDADLAGDTIKASAAGLAFTNQPANDGLEVVSSNAADTTQTLTVVGTTQGTDTVVVETVTLNGTTPVSFVKVDWGVVLAAWLSAAALGTVTLREASADATVVAFTAGQLTKGAETVTAGQAYNVIPTLVCSGTGTKQIGLKGTNSAGTVIYDSQALNGATAVNANVAFRDITEVYTGDLEATRTVTIAVGAAEAESLRVGKIVGVAAARGDVAAVLFLH